MPRPLVYGNGSLLIGIDAQYAIRDLFWPQVGQPNHLNGHKIRMGVWVDGRFAWTDGDGWHRDLRYRDRSPVGSVTLSNAHLGVELQIEEGVDPLHPEFVRKIRVKSKLDRGAEVRIFFTHDLRIAQSDVGDTALYNPFLEGMVHYKGRHWFLFGGSTEIGGPQQYATGIKAFGGMEGTWRDAEDGSLGGNPIAQGSVDSTFGLHLKLAAGQDAEAWYWILCGETLDDLESLHRLMVQRGPGHTLREADRYGRAWLKQAQDPAVERLPKPVADLFFRSLSVMATQIDDQGAILAANDTDIMQTNRATYSYMWPRDGALVAEVFESLGYRSVATRYFDFCARILSPQRPILLQKYSPDGSVGASWHPWVADGVAEVPFQEDETALTVSAIWNYYDSTHDIEVLGRLWNEFVRPAADYMANYVDPPTGLPCPSWDLWEERRGVHTWTVSSVIQALRSAASAGEVVGEPGAAESYRVVADRMHDALTLLYSEDQGRFARMMSPAGELDLTPDASTLAPLLLDVLPPDDPRVVANFQALERDLRIRSRVDGYGRYTGDYYFRTSDRYPGNPWIICTLWMSQARIRMAKTLDELNREVKWLEWTARHAASSGVLPEQLHPETGGPLSVSPLTWSHAEYVKTVHEFVRAQGRLAANVSML